MRRFEYRRFFVGSLIVLGLSTAGAVSPVQAQENPSYPGEAQVEQLDDAEDGMDWGWLGLLGLAGLLGLRKRDRDVHVDHTNASTRNRV